MKKKNIKLMVKSAKELQAQTKGTTIIYKIYSGGCYALDLEEDNIIEIAHTEEEAIETINGLNEYSGYDTGCYYKPELIDEITGERISRKNFEYYKIKDLITA